MLQRECRQVYVDPSLVQYAVKLVSATRAPDKHGLKDLARFITYGASPRALQALVRAARVRAVMAGRPHVDVDDLQAVALPVLRHRILLRLESELDGQDADATLAALIGEWRRRL